VADQLRGSVPRWLDCPIYCQAFARFLGPPETILDSQGGTEIIATLPLSSDIRN
jgi:hypothetical protein